MNNAEMILSEFIQAVAGTTDQSSIPYVMKGSQGPAYAIEQQASGTNRASDATTLLVNDLKRQAAVGKLIQLAILRIRTGSKPPLLMRELVTITEGVQAVVGQKPSQFMHLHDERGPVGDQLTLSLVYWTKDSE